ncbi:hypothetical protein ACH5RR_036395 [Cinchona calisaya]|uniref:F-box associated beta-propeller type 3 domain-containing protein n=1 Tax=Cinchona calisaya TaxID=153742 RepID=A0ABD2Y4J4_9GENT
MAFSGFNWPPFPFFYSQPPPLVKPSSESPVYSAPLPPSPSPVPIYQGGEAPAPSPSSGWEGDDKESALKPVMANSPRNAGHLHVLGSTNGLVCIGLDFAGYLTIYACNPILGEYLKLPIIINRYFSGSYGFGFDPSTNRYKFVQILAETNQLELDGAIGTYAHIFSLGVDVKWWKVEHGTRLNILGAKMNIVFLNVNILCGSMGLSFQGGIHWIIDNSWYWFDQRGFTFIYAFDTEIVYLYLVLLIHMKSIYGQLENMELGNLGLKSTPSERIGSDFTNSFFCTSSARMWEDAEMLMFCQESGLRCYNPDKLENIEIQVNDINNLDLVHAYLPSLISVKNFFSGASICHDLPTLNGKGEMLVRPLAVLDGKLVQKGTQSLEQILIHWHNLDVDNATWED